MAKLKQGQSAIATEAKKRNFTSVIKRSFEVATDNKWRSYTIIDTNCGCGHNKLFDVPGSPNVITSIASEFPHISTRLLLIDKDRKATDELSEGLFVPSNVAHTILCKDNAEALAWVANDPEYWFGSNCWPERENPDYTPGLLFVDPNGSVDIPWEEMQKFCKVYPRFDIVIYWNGSRHKGDKALAESGKNIAMPPRVAQHEAEIAQWKSGAAEAEEQIRLAVTLAEVIGAAMVEFKRLEHDPQEAAIPKLRTAVRLCKEAAEIINNYLGGAADVGEFRLGDMRSAIVIDN